MLNKTFIVLIVTFVSFLKTSSAIWCYRCTSATPGCGEDFNWRGVGFYGEQCPESKDICVKLIETKDARVSVTRDCLSSFRGFRTDIPPDHYEGCRPAATDVHLANYVNHSIPQDDVKRNFYPDIQFCFCFLDHRCNGAETTFSSMNVKIMGVLLVVSAFKLAIKIF